jgi:nitrite reductase (NADH) large subunit
MTEQKIRTRVVVIGNGMAGARFVEELSSLDSDRQFEIAMFGDEPQGNYNRIQLSSILAGTKQPDEIFVNSLDWYADNGIRLHSGVAVEAVDRDARTVLGSDGVVESYDHLVFATGSRAFLPPIPGTYADDGALKEGVFVFRTLEDCERISERASSVKTAIVIGGGLLGLEAAYGLHQQGLDVHVVHLMGHLMETQLDPDAGAVLERAISEMGITVHLNASTTEITGDPTVTGVTFADGSTLAAQLVIVAAGIRSNVTLARECSLPVKKGILIGDDLVSTGDDSVYAIGECSEHRGTVHGLVAPAWQQAKILAQRLADPESEALYTGSSYSTALKVAGVDLVVMGDKEPASADDDVIRWTDPSNNIFKQMIIRDGRLAGATMIGDDTGVAGLIRAYDSQEEVPARRSDLLFPSSGDAILTSVADLADTAQVCNCNGVCKGEIVDAVTAGATSLKAVGDVNRAGTGCGTCKPQIQELIEAFSSGPVVTDPSEHYYVPGVPLEKAALVRTIKEHGLRSVSVVCEVLGSGEADVLTKTGLASLLKTIWGADYDDERDARFINDRVHANIQNDGTFSVIPRIYGGVTTPDELRRIADAADKYDARMVKLTGGQRIDLLGIKKENLPAIWQDLGMPSGHAYAKTMRTCKTCVGAQFCRFAVGDSTALGIAIEKKFQGIESPHKVKMAVSGCPRNCAEATTKDIGAVAIDGGRWEVYVGGAAGATVRKGDVLVTVDTHDEVMQFMGRFFQYYRENARYKERTYGFVERIGVDRLKALLLDDAEGICERLDSDMQAAVDDYVDPWTEAETPTHTSQFESVVASV